MTNRERLMDEIKGLDNMSLYQALESETAQGLDRAMCRDCKRQNGGECPSTEDDECKMYVEDWMDHEWTGEPIVRRGTT